MGKVDALRESLRGQPRERWLGFLTENSGLPGPRGNIELGEAFADEADAEQVDEALATGEEYLTFCGVIGLGRMLAERPDDGLVLRLHQYAADDRWRVREGVAMALQRVGDADPARLHALVLDWAIDDQPLVQRAAAAGICEPRLLRDPSAAAVAVRVCRLATDSLAARPADVRRDAGVRALRQGLGYCWSVAVAADPGPGLEAFRALEAEAARADSDVDVAWIVRENRKKARLARLL